jgi:hypothetical protein
MKIETKQNGEVIIGEKLNKDKLIEMLEAQIIQLNDELDAKNLQNVGLSDRLEYLQSELKKRANIKDINVENFKKEKWSWNIFWVGLSKFGITDSVIVSFFVLVLAQMIEYLELLSLPDNHSFVVWSGLLVIFLKSLKQNIKEFKK